MKFRRSNILPEFIVLMLAAGLVFGAGKSASGQSSSSKDGIVSFWSFDGSLKDEAGNAKDNLKSPSGKAARFVSASDVPGTVGSAVALGVNKTDVQYLIAPITKDVKLGSTYTIEAWIYPMHLAEWNRLVMHWGNAPNYAYHLAIHDGILSLCHGQASGKFVFCEGGRILENQLQHVAAVAQRNEANPARSTLNVYLNGRLTGTAAYDGTVRTLKIEGLGIGDTAGGTGPKNRFRGYLDELAIWNRALSAKEIQARYNSPKRADAMRKFELARKKADQDRIKQETSKRTSSFAQFKKLGVEEIIFAQRHPGRDPSGHYYANFGYSCINPNQWLHGRDGGKLCKLNLRTGQLKVVLDDPGGAVRDPQVHYDAKKILFSYRKGGTYHYNLYEINIDGTGLRQITGGPWDDIEPTYLPDGDIVFSSSRCKRWIGCWLAESAILYRCDAKGKKLRMLSSGAFTENTPAVLPDGRVLYTRWEYVNRDPVVFHHLWTMNPDGTAPKAYFGNVNPGGVFIDAQPIRGTDRVVLIHSPAHGRNEHEGHVAMVTDRFGPDERSAMRNISRARNFRDPYPLSEDSFLVARGSQILLMNAKGSSQVLYTGKAMLHEPRPVIVRPREKKIPSRVDLTKTTGRVILTDVHKGRNMEGIKPGQIKKLLILEDLPKPANFHGGGSQPIGHGVTSTLKRILGTVPVGADGSACFEVPALRSLYFVALDKNDLSIKQMRSFVTLQPGETVSCVGCHGKRNKSPSMSPVATELLAKTPSQIEPIKDVPAIMDFPRDVQPILDRHCVKCHGHDRRDGGVSLVGDRGPVFSHSYYELLLFWQVKDTAGNPTNGSGRQLGNDRPYSTYSSASPLMKKIEPSHYKVKLSDREKRTIRLWIDISAQYPGTYAAYGTGQVGGCWGNNRPVRVMADNWPSTAAARDAVSRRCISCHGRMFPKHVTDRIPLDPWGDMLSWQRPMSRYSRHRVYNLSRPEKSLVLLSALSRKAGGYAQGKPETKRVSEDRKNPPKPFVHPVIFADTKDPDYKKILTHIQAANAKLDEIKRFDMPGFKPNKHYVREMIRYDILPKSFDLAKDPIDVYATDEAYWQSLWHSPPKKNHKKP